MYGIQAMFDFIGGGGGRRGGGGGGGGGHLPPVFPLHYDMCQKAHKGCSICMQF